jgi:hypothetical protein
MNGGMLAFEELHHPHERGGGNYLIDVHILDLKLMKWISLDVNGILLLPKIATLQLLLKTCLWYKVDILDTIT